MEVSTKNICFVFIFVVSCVWYFSAGEQNVRHVDDTGAEEVEERIDAYGLPGAQYEIKVEVGAAGMECFYQRLKKGAELHVSFEVSIDSQNKYNFLFLLLFKA